METILNEIRQERIKQETKWGEQNHPVLDPALVRRDPTRMCEELEIPSETRAKRLCEVNNARGANNWMTILVEEVSEAASCGEDVVALRKELIQVAAVAVAAIESLDRNGK